MHLYPENECVGNLAGMIPLLIKFFWILLIACNTSFSQERTLVLLFWLTYQNQLYSLVPCTDSFCLMK